LASIVITIVYPIELEVKDTTDTQMPAFTFALKSTMEED